MGPGCWLASQWTWIDEGELWATQRAYRKEAERLLLRAVLERKKALPSLGVEDVGALEEFLSNPLADWCGPRDRQRWSLFFRPLEGPLVPAALRHAQTILRSLFALLMSQGVLSR